jgi:hypothetical protein
MCQLPSKLLRGQGRAGIAPLHYGLRKAEVVRGHFPATAREASRGTTGFEFARKLIILLKVPLVWGNVLFLNRIALYNVTSKISLN